ncbi:MAG: hypothetical protein ABH837_02935, partial [bacterium]
LWVLFDELSVDQERRLFFTKLLPWKIIHLGTGPKTAEEFYVAIDQAGGIIGDWARAIIRGSAFSVADHPTPIDLVIITVADLGFPKGAKYRDICAQAQKVGLLLCPLEVGPLLFLLYAMDQPKGGSLSIATELPSGTPPGDYIGIFSITHNDLGHILYPHCGDPDNVWQNSCQIVFCLPAKSK